MLRQQLLPGAVVALACLLDELVGQLDPALVLPNDSTAALAEGMRRWVTDAARRTERGRDARRLAVAHFDWERVVDRVEAVCAEVAVAQR